MTGPVVSFDLAREILKDDRVIALDLETTGFSPWKSKISVITLYGETSKTPLILHYPGMVVPSSKTMDWLADFDLIVTHNGVQFDILFLVTHGMSRWREPKWWDTLIGEQCVLSSGRRDYRVNLQDSLRRRLGKTIDKSIDHAGWNKPTLTDAHIAYCTGDIAHLIDLREGQIEKANADQARALEFEMGLIPLVVEMEINGLPIDRDALESYLIELNIREQDLAPKIYEFLGGTLNLNSSVQLKKCLESRFGEGVFQDTRKETMKDLAIFGGEIGDFCELMLEYRACSQRLKMFGDDWQYNYIVDHDYGTRVHGRFWQIGTDTGRMSSSQPNLQQVPRDMRAVFAAEEGMKVGKVDYAQIEVRVAAALANDDVMIGDFETQDIHTNVAATAFAIPVEEVTPEQRKAAKAISFTLLFGGGVKTILSYAKNNGSTISYDDADKAMDRFFDRYRAVKRMKDRAQHAADRRRPYEIVYPSGLRRILVGQDLRATVILNNAVQGLAASGIKRSLYEMRAAGVIHHVSALVHDETVVVAPDKMIAEVVHEVEKSMVSGMAWALEGGPPIEIAVESTYGQSWLGEKANVRTFKKKVCDG